VSTPSKDWLTVASPAGRSLLEYWCDSDANRDWLLVSSEDQTTEDAAAVHAFLNGVNLEEGDVRDAVVHILRSGHASQSDLYLIASLFAPQQDGSLKPQQTVAFKKTSQGHARPLHDLGVACEVQACRNRGDSYEKAIGATAEKFKLGERHVKRIYARLTSANLVQ
jgi:hypothetical protein